MVEVGFSCHIIEEMVVPVKQKDFCVNQQDVLCVMVKGEHNNLSLSSTCCLLAPYSRLLVVEKRTLPGIRIIFFFTMNIFSNSSANCPEGKKQMILVPLL